MNPPKEDDKETRRVSYASDYLSLSDDELSFSEFDFKDLVDGDDKDEDDQNKSDPNGPGQATTLQTYHNLSRAFMEQDKPDQALVVYKKALKIQMNAVGPNHADTAEIYFNMARAYAKQGKGEKAKALFQKAFGIYCRTLGPHNPSTVKTKELLEWMPQDAEDEASQPTSKPTSQQGKTTNRRKASQESDDSDCIIS